jgi:hypothetical protein
MIGESKLVVTEWRTIPGFEAYEASFCGLIRPKVPRYKNGRGAMLRPWIVTRHNRDSAYVSLHVDGKRTKCLVHRLVALAWHGLPPEGKPDCAHIDHDSLNNKASNLRWMSHSDNIAENWEREVEQRARLEDACGLEPIYLGPDPRSDVPF